jgi:membrane protein YqaA with SNARE-associated domain
MSRFITWAQALAMGVGGPGLFLVCFIDSSSVSLPEVNDVLMVYMTTRAPSLMVYFAAMATAGSILGCLVVYYIGRKGGSAMLQKRFRTDRVDRAIAAFRRHGLIAVIVPAMMPPPVPLKLFVLSAGVAGMSTRQLIAAIAIGRGLRFLILGVLAIFYGEAVINYLHAHVREAGMAAGACVALTLAAYCWQHRQRATGEV